MKTTFSLTRLVAISAAWAVATAASPSLTVQKQGNSVRIVAAGVDPAKRSLIERSSNLVDWIEMRSFTPGYSAIAITETPKSRASFFRLIQDPSPQSLVAASTYQPVQSGAIPGMSITVITNGQISWSRGFGFLAKGRPELVDGDTLFQAGSISKSLTALAALRMVEAGLLSLDEPVCRRLTSLAIPGRNGTNVTVRHILSHTGGFSFIPYSGYAVGSPIPTALQILKGQPPANTPAEASNGPLGTWVYSNGAYIFLQVLMTDVSGQAFPDLLHELVLQPLNMGCSTFAQPLPANLEVNAACGHVGGAVIRGNWRVNPGLAAAGLWTTSTDLAGLLTAVRAAYRGDAGSIIAQNTAQEMLRLHTVGGAPWGLGFVLKVTGGVTESFWHAGQTDGYLCVFALLIDSGDGVAILTNSDDIPSVQALYDACEMAYGWPSDLLP